MVIKTLINLIKGEKIAEAGKQLAKYVAGVKISPGDQGSVYAETASVYLRAQTDMLERYKEFLKEAKEGLGDLNLQEKLLTPPEQQ